MRNITFLGLLSIILCTSACVLSPTPLDIDIPEAEQRLVIASFSLPPQELLLTFSRTFSALIQQDSTGVGDPDILGQILVDSGLVTLTYAGRIDTLSRLAPGVFASLNAEQIDNEKYTLFARDYKTGKSIFAETVLLPPVSLDSVEVKPRADSTLWLYGKIPGSCRCF
jgi:hypothetical protein